MAGKIWERLEKLFEPRIVAAGMTAVSAFIAGGLAYVMAHRPPPMAGTRLVWPSINIETSAEMLVVSLLYMLGFAGLWMTYEAAKHKHRGEYVHQYLLGGVTLFLLAFLMLYLMYAMKR